MNNWFDDDAPGVGRIFFARNIVRTWAAWLVGISGSHGKPRVVATVRTAELGLPLGNSVANWLLYHPAVLVYWVKLSI